MSLNEKNQVFYEIIVSALSSIVDQALISPESDNAPVSSQSDVHVTYSLDYMPHGTPGRKYLTETTGETTTVTDTIQITQEYTGNLTLDFYNKGAKAASYSFWLATLKESILLQARAAGVALLYPPVITDLSALNISEIQERYQVSFDVRFTDTTTETVYSIETMDEPGITLNN